MMSHSLLGFIVPLSALSLATFPITFLTPLILIRFPSRLTTLAVVSTLPGHLALL